MDIASYTSNIQPFATSNGTELANNKQQSVDSKSPSSTDLHADNVVKHGEEARTMELSQEKTSELIKKIAKERHDLNEQERQKMVDKLDEFVSNLTKDLSFRVDEESGRSIVTVYSNNGDIIRQIPDKELLDVLLRLERHSSGLIEERV
ncbi:flagellar protein FlaG [Vibrio sp. ZSDZ34]|jgi:flagellar protein FlaG|uniref:Flagellar protein FlaG n=1 Tax=Vibrio gelatinilyticus TaxID=2893468 RepID=A0A9X2AWH0_9VIBR|nr:flagellar protein FlaG [Vibrio gelatinilyticus]MCJ2377350.1 flagellar protein FlaG [Vibrio gelatinilyticus]